MFQVFDEIKKQYTDYLISLLTPFLYEGFQSLYNTAKETEKQLIEQTKTQPNIKNPGILVIFQEFIKNIPDLNDEKITKETNRIRDLSQSADIFDDLIKAVIKSNIILLTYSASNKECKIVNERFHQNVESKIFIHKCYIECARIFYDHPDLFWHEFKSNDIKHNQRIIYQLIRVAINKAIMNMLPLKSILEEYLNKDYIEIPQTGDNNYKSVKDMINRDIYNKENEDLGGTGGIFVTSSVSGFENNPPPVEQDNGELILGNDETNEIGEIGEIGETNNGIFEEEKEGNNENSKNNEKEENNGIFQPKASFREDYEESNIEENKNNDIDIVSKLMNGKSNGRSKSGNNILLEAIEKAKKENNSNKSNNSNNSEDIQIIKPTIQNIPDKLESDNAYFGNFMK
jgi:hypothetical protein